MYSNSRGFVIGSHLKKSGNDLIHLLLKKLPYFLALEPESSRWALIKLAQILQRDTSLAIQPSELQFLPSVLISIPPPVILTPEEKLVEYYLKTPLPPPVP